MDDPKQDDERITGSTEVDGSQEFNGAINEAIGHDVAYFANPDISVEEAIIRLMSAREVAKSAIDVAGTPVKIGSKNGAPAPEIAELGSQEQEETKQAEVVLESNMATAGTIGEIQDAIRRFNRPIVGSVYTYDSDFICQLIDGVQSGGLDIYKITNKYGIRVAVMRVLGISDKPSEGPTPPNPGSSELDTPAFQNIPLKDGRIISGYVESSNESMVHIRTPQGLMDVARSGLLNYNGIYSLGDAADLQKLDSVRQEEARKREEERIRVQSQSPPATMQMGGSSH
jgi:hypothetical protein